MAAAMEASAEAAEAAATAARRRRQAKEAGGAHFSKWASTAKIRIPPKLGQKIKTLPRLAGSLDRLRPRTPFK